MRRAFNLRRVCRLLGAAAWIGAPALAVDVRAADEPKPPARVIQDNSFLLEEGYNQEPNIVQHIFNMPLLVNQRGRADERELTLNFTQEWPIGGQTHQFSYTVPYAYMSSGGEEAHGFGDVLINYRLQAMTESEDRPAVAPRFSLVLPTGNDEKGLGAGAAGFQTNTAASKVVTDRLTIHGNAGLTWFPDAAGGHDLLSYNLGASAIYALTNDLNFMLECRSEWLEEEAPRGRTDHSTVILLSPGLRYGITRPGVQVVLGLGVPIGLTGDAPDYGLVLYLSVEHVFAK